MSVLIKGMEMPKDGYIDVRLFSDDTATTQTGQNPFYKEFQVVDVPPHGRLIDADAVFDNLERTGWYDNADRDIAEDLVLDAPTFIPASGEET